MAHRPEIFISSTTADLGTARQAISDALVMSGCRPITQQISTPDAASARESIKSRLSDCDGVIHLAGLHYGEEPTERGLTEARRSYVQLEHEVARELQKPIYVFVCADGYAYDKGDPEPPELQDLQREHRNRLLSSGLPFTLVHSPTELYQQITDLPLRETEAAKPPDIEEVERNRIRRLSFNVALALALVVAGFAGLNWLGDREIAKPLATPTPVPTPVIVKATPVPVPKIAVVATPTPVPATPVAVATPLPATPAKVAVATTPLIATPIAISTPAATPRKTVSAEPVVMTPRATPEPNEPREEVVDSRFAEEPAMRDEIVRAYEKEASNSQGSARLRKLLQAYRDKLRAAGVEDWEITLRLMSAARGNTTMAAPVVAEIPENLPTATPKPVATPAKTTPRPASTPAPVAPKSTPAAKKTTGATPTPTPKARPSASPTPKPKATGDTAIPRPKPKAPTSDEATPRPKPKAPASDDATPKPKPKPSPSDDATPKPKPKPSTSDNATPRPKPKPSASDEATPKPKPKASSDGDATPKPKPKPKPQPQPEV